jgi:hypothetical protein
MVEESQVKRRSSITAKFEKTHMNQCVGIQDSKFDDFAEGDSFCAFL